MAVDRVRMPPEWSRGFSAGFDFGTSVLRFDRGRNAVMNRELPERRWTGNKGLFKAAKGHEFLGFARARRGAFYGCLFTDLSEFTTSPSNPQGAPTLTDQYLGEGDGVRTRFPIRRTYNSVPNDLLQRLGIDDRMIPIVDTVDDRLASKIGLPLGSTITSTVALNGVSAGAFTFDFVAREFVMSSPPAVGQVTWGGYYDWPVSLSEETDKNLEAITEAWGTANVPAIQLELLEFDRFIPETDDPGGFGTLTWSTGMPLLSKAYQKHWALNPTAGGLSVQIEDVSRHAPGGPHIELYNISAFSILVKDELTGTTMFTLGAAGSATCVAHLHCQDNGSTVQWHAVIHG